MSDETVDTLAPSQRTRRVQRLFYSWATGWELFFHFEARPTDKDFETLIQEIELLRKDAPKEATR